MTRLQMASLVFAGALVGVTAGAHAQGTPTPPTQNPTLEKSTEGAKPILNAPVRPAEPAPPATAGQQRSDAETRKAEQQKPPTGAPASPRTSEGAPMQPDDKRTMDEKKKAEENKPR